MDVINLATGETQTYIGLNPVESLVSAAILEDGLTYLVSDKDVRARYFNKIVWGGKVIFIGCLGTLRFPKGGKE